MIDWWSVAYNGLWIAGSALILAAFSLAHYRARAEGVPIRRTLSRLGFQLALAAGLALVFAGLFFGSRTWWERAIWGTLALLLTARALWQGRAEMAAFWRQQIREEPAGMEAVQQESRSNSWLGCGLVMAGVAVLALWVIVTGTRLLDSARTLQAHIQELETLVGGDLDGVGLAELETAGEHLAGMHEKLTFIQDQIGPFLPAAGVMDWVPTYGGDLAAASDLLEIAVGVSAAGDRTFQALSPALALLDSPEGAHPELGLGERLLPVLIEAQPELEAAQRELDAAQAARDRLDTAKLSPRVAGLVERLDRYLPWFEIALDGARLAPELLGADGPRTYLIIAQNNQELRPTGGFISGVGELTIEEGRLGNPSFGDSYAVDNLKVPHDVSPVDFYRTLFGELIFFRDFNWDADFPTSAQRALAIYGRDQGLEADGVIALDLEALQLLVGAVGPIQVEGIETPVDGGNVLQVMQNQWSEVVSAKEEEWWLHRKDFMGQIASAAMERVTTGQGLQPLKLIWAIKTALEERHLLIYLTDEEATALLHEQKWDGAQVLVPEPADQLMVVDSNVGFNKMDVNVERTISYRVDLAAGEAPRSRLVLTYRNLSDRPVGECVQESRYGETYEDLTHRCYWDYVRVYVPAGSELLAGPDLPLPAGSLYALRGEDPFQHPVSRTLSTDDWEVWTAFFALEPLGEQTLTFEYTLPPRVLEQAAGGEVTYRLYVQKQPGTVAVPLRVEIALPADAHVLEAEPTGSLVGPPAGPVSASTDLRTDRRFVLLFRRGEEGP